MGNEISFSGLGSGIDFNLVRDAIIASRSRSITVLQNKVNTFNGRIDGLKELNAGLAGLITASESLTDRTLGFGRATNTSAAAIATAQSEASTTIGSYNLNITRLASNLTQSSRSYASEDTAVLAGGATSATFELRKGGSAEGVEITIDSASNTLAGLRDAINAADAGVTATIIDVQGDGTSNQLVLTSDETGSAGRVELVETTATGTLADIDLTTVNPSGGNFSDLDAEFSINNLTINRSSNVVSDAISGVTFTLKDVGSTTISVTESSDIENKLRSFILAYNSVQGFIGGQYETDATGRPTGILAGESTTRSVQRQLRDIVRTTSDTNGGNLTNLFELGVTVDENGQLDLDTAVLNERLADSSEDVRSLLYGATESDTGIFQQVESITKSLGDSITGSVQTAITGYESSISNLGKTISSRLENINRLRDSLTRQFAAADAAIGQLNGQGTALANIIKSLEPRNSD
ncbi:MAG: flagellar filament capping protein FliD [Pyrinomonadaceae bacterium]|nr:flagellar filament capping protein FliD [Pyrinomonadaceae bacterium]